MHLRSRTTWIIALFVCLGLAAFVLLASREEPDPEDIARIGTIRHPDITECSGIIASRRYPGVFWTHNDQGNAPAIFAIRRDGSFMARFIVDARNGDWEDIAIDDQGRLYIGQIGNNGAKKTSAAVYRIDEPDPTAGSSSTPLKVTKAWDLRYPGDPFDSESLFIHAGYGYVISKIRKMQEFAGIYRFPLDAPEGPVTLEKIAELPILAPLTGADLSADARRLVVVGETGVDVFEVNGRLESAGHAPQHCFPFMSPQRVEACCFVPDGILAAAESREVFLFKGEGSPGGSADLSSVQVKAPKSVRQRIERMKRKQDQE